MVEVRNISDFINIVTKSNLKDKYTYTENNLLDTGVDVDKSISYHNHTTNDIHTLNLSNVDLTEIMIGVSSVRDIVNDMISKGCIITINNGL